MWNHPAPVSLRGGDNVLWKFCQMRARAVARPAAIAEKIEQRCGLPLLLLPEESPGHDRPSGAGPGRSVTAAVAAGVGGPIPCQKGLAKRGARHLYCLAFLRGPPHQQASQRQEIIARMSNSMDKLFSEVKSISEGQVVKGRILAIRPSEVLVDIGYKSEGVVPLAEFENPESLSLGDEIEVLLEKLEDEDGMVVLSHDKAQQKKNWDRIVAICSEGGTVEGRVKAKVKGGLMVNIGVDAFLPGSQVDVVPPRNLDEYIGKTFNFKVVKINAERRNIVLSRRELIEHEREEKRRNLLANMHVGEIRPGVVKNLTDFGAFIDLDGMDGLLHVSDMTWGRITHPSELLKVGDTINVMILEIDREKGRVSLGLKQKSRNPWDHIEQRYPPGSKITGRVVSVLPYGAFVEIEEGVEGLVHVSELSWTKRITRASDVLKAGDTIEAVVLEIKKDGEKKISLGIRQLTPNPWSLVPRKYPPGTRVTGRVRNLTSFGAFVEIEEGIDGMIHVSDMSWTRRVLNPAEMLKKGQKVETVVLEVDAANQRIALGLKQAGEDPWRTIDQRYKVGDLVQGRVVKLTNFGAFVELPDKIEGLVHISQIREDRVDNIKNALKIGEEVSARVIKIDAHERRIGLSIKAANYSMEQLEAEKQQYEAALKPGEAIVDLEHAFEQAREDKNQ
jgi:small subunit ribosomal protein S1